MGKKKWFAKTLALMLAAALLPWPQDLIFAENVPLGAEPPAPAYFWDFEDVSEGTVENKGSVSGGNAVLHGASAQQSEISIGGQNYAKEGNSVLDLVGGKKGTSYVIIRSYQVGWRS